MDERDPYSICWIIGEMELMRQNYIQDTTRNPLGWIMGVNEYQNIKSAIAARMNEEQRKLVKEMSHFQGLPIVLKGTPGVELSMDIEAAVQYKEMRIELIQSKEEALT